MSQLLYLHSHREDSHLFIVVVLILSFPRRKESKVIEIGLLGTELVRFVIIQLFFQLSFSVGLYCSRLYDQTGGACHFYFMHCGFKLFSSFFVIPFSISQLFCFTVINYFPYCLIISCIFQRRTLDLLPVVTFLWSINIVLIYIFCILDEI